MLRVTLQIDEHQLEVLLEAIETVMGSELYTVEADIDRGAEFADACEKMGPCLASYDIDMLAPIYRQLLPYWPHEGTAPSRANSGIKQIQWGKVKQAFKSRPPAG